MRDSFPLVPVSDSFRARARSAGRVAGCRRVVPTFLLALSLLLATGCHGIQSVTGPETSIQRFGGVEQVLTLNTNPTGSSGTRTFNLTSQLVNRGEAPVTLRVRTCYLRPGIDIVFTPGAQFVAIAEPGCIQEPDVITLQPGDSSSTVFFHATIQDSGIYQVAVRHSIDPEFRGKLSIFVK
jgi:hypothetical protein